MTDLDFDELDKAISNVLTTEETPTETVRPVSSLQPSSLSNDANSSTSSSSSNVAANDSPKPLIQPRTSVDRPSNAPRRGGVIDIMAPPSSSAPRLSPVLRPIASNDVKLLEKSYVEIKETENSAPATEGFSSSTFGDPVPVTNDDTPHVEQDDDEAVFIQPAEMIQNSEAFVVKSPATEEVVFAEPVTVHEVVEPIENVEEQIKDEPIQQAAPVESGSAQTPFLANTKVEKRPLGNNPIQFNDEAQKATANANFHTADERPVSAQQPVAPQAHISGVSTEHKKSGKGLLIGACIFLIVVIAGVTAIFLFGDQLGL
jgi:hypothetical protein